MTARNIDPVTFEVIQNGLDSLVDEMAITIMRTAYSGIVKDALDYSTALCDRNGRVIAQGLTIIMHLGSFPSIVNSIIRQYEGRIYPGDVFIANDPYESGGIHLPDVFIIKPIFVNGELEAYAGTVAHQTDIGGLVSGSNATESVEIYQEGLRIPTLKLYERGEANKTLFAMIEINVRVPEMVLGDMRSQIAANAIGERSYLELSRRYGAELIRNFSDELLDYSERLARQEISELPDGEYEWESYIDADNTPEGPVKICVKLTIRGDEIDVDMTGSTPQVRAGINSPLPFTEAAIYGAIRLIMDPGIPNAAGYQRPIHIHVPEATVVNPVHPAPCAARGITGFRTMDAVMGALAQAVPDRVPADGEGGNTNITVGGYHEDHTAFAFVDLFAGGRGGRPTGDGPDGVPHPAANIACTPVEIAEADHPILIEAYGLIQDTGGPGKFRGSLGHVRQIRNLAGRATLQIRSDKRKFPPYGLHGGGPGSRSQNILNPGPDEVLLRTMVQVEIECGDVLRHEMSSGGGWGDPLERDPALVVRDVLDEKVSIPHAAGAYGVVVNPDTLEVDEAETVALRNEIRSQRD